MLVHLPLAALFLILLSACAGPEARIVAASARVISAADKLPGDHRELAKAAAELRPVELTETRIRGFSSETVYTLHSAAKTAAFYDPGAEDLVLLQARTLDEKIRRTGESKMDLRGMFIAYMGARMFDAARALRVRHPSIQFPSIPDEIESASISKPGSWSAYAISNGWKRADLKSLPFDRGVRVVMVILPGCPAAEAALEDLLGNAETAGAFRRDGFILTARFDAEGVSLWKKHFAFEQMFITRKAADFPGLDFDDSPRFYFLRDGKIVSDFIGWDGTPGPTGSRARFLAEFKRLEGA